MMFLRRTIEVAAVAALCHLAPIGLGGADAQPPSPRDSLQAAHLLNRLTFGARPGDLGRVLAMGVDRWIDEQLRPHLVNDSAAVAAVEAIQPRYGPEGLLSYIRSNVTMGGRPASSSPSSVAARPFDAMAVSGSYQRHTMSLTFASAEGATSEASVRRVVRAESSNRQLLEIVTDFWLNHFSVFAGKMPSPVALIDFERTAVQPNALGRFRTLLGAVARSPAMLFYLDNHLSSASGLNENFARELLELHTLGVDGGYTQEDVVAVARAFSGWGIVSAAPPPPDPLPRNYYPPPFAFQFDAARHDAERKVVLGRTLPAGRGIEDGEDVLDILARHPATARFIARKLVVRLVGDVPPQSLIQRAAETFAATDGDIGAVVRTIVSSAEFREAGTFRSKVKSPYEFALSIRRAMDLPGESWPWLASTIGQMQQPIYGRDTPEGWPETAARWLNQGAMFNRLSLSARAASGELWFMSADSSTTWRPLTVAPFEVQFDAVVEYVFSGRLSAATRAALLASRPVNNETPGRERLAALLELAFSSPEFQRR